MGQLRDRMDADLRLRGLSENTRRLYLRCARDFAAYCGRSPAVVGTEEVRAFLRHLVNSRRAPSTCGVYAAALRFLYDVTLDRPAVAARIPRRRVPERLPTILSTAEVERLLAAVHARAAAPPQGRLAHAAQSRGPVRLPQAHLSAHAPPLLRDPPPRGGRRSPAHPASPRPPLAPQHRALHLRLAHGAQPRAESPRSPRRALAVRRARGVARGAARRARLLSPAGPPSRPRRRRYRPHPRGRLSTRARALPRPARRPARHRDLPHPLLGGHLDVCATCDHTRPAYKSCRNRHCPKCQALLAARWIDARMARLLPTPYFHLVFTLPAALRGLVLHNRRRLFAPLFAAASLTCPGTARRIGRRGSRACLGTSFGEGSLLDGVAVLEVAEAGTETAQPGEVDGLCDDDRVGGAAAAVSGEIERGGGEVECAFETERAATGDGVGLTRRDRSVLEEEDRLHGSAGGGGEHSHGAAADRQGLGRIVCAPGVCAGT